MHLGSKTGIYTGTSRGREHGGGGGGGGPGILTKFC
jgi:hypothetical protein